MSLSDDVLKELNKYTKEELIIAIKNDYRGDILKNLPMIKYNRIIKKAEEFAKKARKAGVEKEYSLSQKYYDKSHKLYNDAFKFHDRNIDIT